MKTMGSHRESRLLLIMARGLEQNLILFGQRSELLLLTHQDLVLGSEPLAQDRIADVELATATAIIIRIGAPRALKGLLGTNLGLILVLHGSKALLL